MSKWKNLQSLIWKKNQKSRVKNQSLNIGNKYIGLRFLSLVNQAELSEKTVMLRYESSFCAWSRSTKLIESAQPKIRYWASE